MSKLNEIQKAAALSRARLIGRQLAERVGDDDFLAGLEEEASDEGFDSPIGLCEALEALNLADTFGVGEFLANHFQQDLADMTREQLDEAAKSFAEALG